MSKQLPPLDDDEGDPKDNLIKQKEALDEAIKIWKGRARNQADDEVCPLCYLDSVYDCRGCPISEVTGLPGCKGTPFDAWAKKQMPAEAKEMLRFLEKVRQDVGRKLKGCEL